MLIALAILLFVIFFGFLAVTLFFLCRAAGMADRQRQQMYRDKWRGGEEFVVPDLRAERERRIRRWQMK